jgi:hypothetical protein
MDRRYEMLCPAERDRVLKIEPYQPRIADAGRLTSAVELMGFCAPPPPRPSQADANGQQRNHFKRIDDDKEVPRSCIASG